MTWFHPKGGPTSWPWGARTAKDGSHDGTWPNTATTTARVMVAAAGNIFFDVNDTNFTITAASGNTVPGAPTNVVGNPGNGQIIVSWNQPLDLGGVSLIGYRVQVSTTQNGTYADAAGCASALTSTQPSCTATGLTNGTQYFFKVAAINSVGQGNFSTASAGASPSVQPPGPCSHPCAPRLSNAPPCPRRRRFRPT